MQLTGERRFNAFRSMCTVRKFAEHMHKEFTTRQIPGLVRLYTITHRGNGHSIGKGAES